MRTPNASPAAVDLGYPRLLKAIQATNTSMGSRAAVVVNQALTLRNWLMGSHIVEYEQNGFDRARYGARLLDRLSRDLKKNGVGGLDVRALRDCRSFFHFYPQIRGSATPGSERSMAAGLPASPSTSGKILERVPPPLNADAGSEMELTDFSIVEAGIIGLGGTKELRQRHPDGIVILKKDSSDEN